MAPRTLSSTSSPARLAAAALALLALAAALAPPAAAASTPLALEQLRTLDAKLLRDAAALEAALVVRSAKPGGMTDADRAWALQQMVTSMRVYRAVVAGIEGLDPKRRRAALAESDKSLAMIMARGGRGATLPAAAPAAPAPAAAAPSAGRRLRAAA
jgi:hypothetical protein